MRVHIGCYPEIEGHEEMRLIRNAIRCRKCNEVIESKSVHHSALCSCKSVGIDGGLEYNRMMGEPEDYECLQEWLITDK